MKLLRLLSLLVVVLLPAISYAQVSGAQASRAVLIQRIAEAQGLVKLFDEQLLQQRDLAQARGQEVFEKLVTESGVSAGPQAKDVLARYVKRTSTLFSSDEYLAVWSKAYADTALTDDDLRTILAYYESPTGKKDGVASQAAMRTFATWLGEQNQARSTVQLDQLAAELRNVLP